MNTDGSEDRRWRDRERTEVEGGSAEAERTDRGVSGYSFDQCWDDYRMATLFCVAYPLVAGGQIDLGNERGVELVGEMARRSLTAVTDLDADSLLDRYEERPPFTG